MLLDGQPLPGARGIKTRRGQSRPAVHWLVSSGSKSSKALRLRCMAPTPSAGSSTSSRRDAAAPFDTTGAVSGGSFGDINARGEPASSPRLVRLVRRRAPSPRRVRPHANDLRHDRRAVSPDRCLGKVSRARQRCLQSAGDGERLRQSTPRAAQTASLDRSKMTSTTTRSTWGSTPTGCSSDHDRRGARLHRRAMTSGRQPRLAPPAGTPLEPGVARRERHEDRRVAVGSASAPDSNCRAALEYWDNAYAGINRLAFDEGEDVRIDSRGVGCSIDLSIADRVTTTLGVAHRSSFGLWQRRVAEGRRQRCGSPSGVTRARLVRPRLSRARPWPALLSLPQSEQHLPGDRQSRPASRNTPIRCRSAADWLLNVAPRARRRERLPQRRERSHRIGQPRRAVTPAQLPAIFTREGLDPSFRPVLGRLLFTYKNVNDAVTAGRRARWRVGGHPVAQLGAASTPTWTPRHAGPSRSHRPTPTSGTRPRDVDVRIAWVYAPTCAGFLQLVDRGARRGE